MIRWIMALAAILACFLLGSCDPNSIDAKDLQKLISVDLYAWSHFLQTIFMAALVVILFVAVAAIIILLCKIVKALREIADALKSEKNI